MEDSVEDEQLVREALAEIEEGQWIPSWRRPFQLAHADRLADGLAFLGQERFDAVLLNLSLPDSAALLNTFRRVQAAAPDTPVLVLADEEDDGLAARVLREGAQEVLLKTELDCLPLLRSLRNSIARHHRAESLRSASFLDELTGLYNQTGFEALAEAQRRGALAAGGSTAYAVLEIAGLADVSGLPDWAAAEERDAALMNVADLMRAMAAEGVICGRISDSQFAVAAANQAAPVLKAWLERVSVEAPAAAGSMQATVSMGVGSGGCLESARAAAAQKPVILTS